MRVRRAAPAPAGRDGSFLRPDIQGLRALAVTVVILDHLIGRPSGGFVGVDIFFVISGFLITQVLLKEHRRTGSISFTGFYRRRAKRILPAASLVLVLTVAAMYIVYSSDRATQTLWDAVAATFFVANWRFAANGTDYFQSAFPASPLQHYWSLSVEEQFYFVWPALMLLAFIAAARLNGGRNLQRAAAVAISLVIAGSLIWGWRESVAQPQLAYFSTSSRAWELGVGALVALAAGRLARVPGAVRPVLAWTGLVGIVVSLLAISSDAPFPVPGAILPVLSSALLIAAGVGHRPRLLWPLTNRASRYVGDISYSLYLWHWPVIVLTESLVPQDRPVRALIAVPIIIGGAVLSYHFLEDPVRRSGWLDRRRRGPVLTPLLRRGLLGSSAVVIVAVLFAVVMQVSNVGDGRARASIPSYRTTQELSDAVRLSLTDPRWPTLRPSSADLSAFLSPALGPECFNDWNLSDSTRCTTRAADADRLAVVLGDSVAMSWVPGVRAALMPSGFAVRALGFSNCPVALVTIRLDASTARCSRQHRAILNAVVRMHPDLIVISDSVRGPGLVADGATGARAIQEWSVARAAAIRVLQSGGARVVLLESNPNGSPISQCKTNFSSPASCVSGLSPEWRLQFMADRLAARATGAQLVDPRSWFCVQGRCPAYVGTTLVRWDEIHLTRQYSALIAPQLAQVLLAHPLRR